MRLLTDKDKEEIDAWENSSCSCHSNPPCSKCMDGEIVYCRYCGEQTMVHTKSYYATGVFNYFCDEKCEDMYSGTL